MWNAYLAQADTMEGAKLIGSIVLGAVQKNPEFKDRFQALMTDCLSLAIKDLVGREPDEYEVENASHTERGGNA
jgi:hypothetical protein